MYCLICILFSSHIHNEARDRFPSTSSTEDEAGEVEQMMMHHEVDEDGLEHMEGMEVMHQEEEEDDDGMMHNIKYEHEQDHEQEGEQDESHGKSLY